MMDDDDDEMMLSFSCGLSPLIFSFFFLLIAARESCRSVCQIPLERVFGTGDTRSSFHHIQVWTETQSRPVSCPRKQKKKEAEFGSGRDFFSSYRHLVSDFSNYSRQSYGTLFVSESFHAGSSCVLDIMGQQKNKHDHVFVRAGWFK